MSRAYRAYAARAHSARRTAVVGVISCVMIAAATAARATVWGPWSGYVDVSHVDAEVTGVDEETLRQDYNLVFSHQLSPWIDFRAAMRYYRFDQDVELLLGSYRQHVQPSGELRWEHPVFLFTTSAFRRETITSSRAKIVTSSFQSSIKTRVEDWPILEMRYDEQHTYSPEIIEDRDIRNSRIQANGTWDTQHHFFSYSLSHIVSQNVVTDISGSGNRHLFRWEGNGRMLGDPKSSLTGRYSLNYATVKNEVLAGGNVRELAPIVIALYELDNAPDFGPLSPRPALSDGNKTDPVLPLIDIGGGNNDHNLGADLGSAQPVVGLYIYTDRPSGDQIQWAVWGSNDNLAWQPLPGAPGQFFNPGVNRYELAFPIGSYRYIKAVNSGINEIALVYVTEIEVLRQLPPGVEETGYTTASHMLDGRASYRFNDRWQSSLDASFQADENVGLPGDRWRSGLGWRLNFEQAQEMSHHLRWDLGVQDGDFREPRLVNNTWGYTLALDPLQTLSGTFSLSDRLSHIGGVRNQNVAATVLEANGTFLPGLNISAGTVFSWVDDYLYRRSYRVWDTRGSIDAALTRTLDLIVTHHYRRSSPTGSDEVRKGIFTTLGFDWRMTSSIYVRASLRYQSQRNRTWTQDYLLSWTIFPGLRVSTEVFEIDTDNVRTTFRSTTNLNWDLTPRASFYMRVATLDFTGVGGTRSELFQQGFRITF